MLTAAKVEAVEDSGARTARVTSSKIHTDVVASVNLRDCGLFTANLKEGILLRSSQVFRYAVGQLVHANLGLLRVMIQVPDVQCFRGNRSADQGQSVNSNLASCSASLFELRSSLSDKAGRCSLFLTCGRCLKSARTRPSLTQVAAHA